MAYTLSVNGKQRVVDAESDTPLLWALRDTLAVLGPKFGCGIGLCGACTVHIDGNAVRSCITPVSSVGTKRVTTIEGIGATPIGAAVQKAWIDHDVIQCGYCQAGQIMSACSLLAKTPKPNDAQIGNAMAGNVCRCGTYLRIHAAIRQAAGMTPPPVTPSTPELIELPSGSAAKV